MDKKDILNSWKEITTYLGKSEKTCRRLAKERGLPVHRLENSPKARVFAFKGKIDEWVEKAEKLDYWSIEEEANNKKSLSKKPILTILFCGFGLMLLLNLLGFWFFGKKNHFDSLGSLKSIVVIPFKDISPGKKQEYVAEEMTSALINTLGSVSDLSVTGLAPAFYLKEKEMDINQIGRELKVDYILKGCISVGEDNLCVTVQLIRIKSGYVCWSGRYEMESNEVFDLQKRILASMIKDLKLSILGEKNGRKISQELTQELNNWNIRK